MISRHRGAWRCRVSSSKCATIRASGVEPVRVTIAPARTLRENPSLGSYGLRLDIGFRISSNGFYAHNEMSANRNRTLCVRIERFRFMPFEREPIVLGEFTETYGGMTQHITIRTRGNSDKRA